MFCIQERSQRTNTRGPAVLAKSWRVDLTRVGCLRYKTGEDFLWAAQIKSKVSKSGQSDPYFPGQRL